MRMLILIISVSLFAGCGREDLTNTSNKEVIRIIEDFGFVGLNENEIIEALNTPKSSIYDNPPCYNIEDLSAFLTNFGSCAKDIIPTLSNDYFQDANCNVAKWESSVREFNPIDSTGVNTNINPVSIKWFLDSDNYINTGSDFTLPFYTYNDGVINSDCDGIFQPSCNGAHSVVIQMEFEDGTIYRRIGTGFAIVNNTPSDIPQCELSILDYSPSDLSYFDFDTFTPIKFEPYEFIIQGLDWDLDNDNCVSTSDLNLFLIGFGDC